MWVKNNSTRLRKRKKTNKIRQEFLQLRIQHHENNELITYVFADKQIQDQIYTLKKELCMLFKHYFIIVKTYQGTKEKFNKHYRIGQFIDRLKIFEVAKWARNTLNVLNVTLDTAQEIIHLLI